MSASASAFPAEQVRPVVEALRRGERVRRGYIGVAMQDVDEGVAAALGIDRNRGTLIRSVTPGGPAARAGVQQGDVVISVAGQPVTPDQSLAFLVAQQPIGSRIPLEVIRQGQRRNVTVAVAERPTEEELARIGGGDDSAPDAGGGDAGKPTDEQSASQRSTRQSLGLSLQALTPALARQLNIRDASQRGLVVGSVDPNSDAGQKGIQPGDVILSINQVPAPTPEAALAAVEVGAPRRPEHGVAAGPPGQRAAAVCRSRAGQALSGWRALPPTPPSPAGSLRELTLRAILLGGAITLVFTAANVYLGLRVGLTFATSIPAAVISMAVLRMFANGDDPREQHRPDRGLGGGDAGGDHLRPARPGHGRLVERLSLLDHRVGDRRRRDIGGDVLGAAAARLGGRYAASLSGGRRRGRGAEMRRRRGGCRGESEGAQADHRQLDRRRRASRSSPRPGCSLRRRRISSMSARPRPAFRRAYPSP